MNIPMNPSVWRYLEDCERARLWRKKYEAVLGPMPSLSVPNTESVTPSQREAKLEDTRQCLWCDETFEDTPATPEDPDFCSESCQVAHENEYGTF